MHSSHFSTFCCWWPESSSPISLSSTFVVWTSLNSTTKYGWSDRHLGTTARTSRRYIYSVTVVVDSSRCCDLCVICTFQDLLTLHYYNGQFTSIGACHNSRYCEFICQQSSGTLNRGWSQDTIHVIIPTMQWSFSGLNQIVYYRCSDHHNNKRDGITRDVKERSAGGGLDGLW